MAITTNTSPIANTDRNPNDVSADWKLIYCSLLSVQFGLQGIIAKMFLEDGIPKSARPSTVSIYLPHFYPIFT